MALSSDDDWIGAAGSWGAWVLGPPLAVCRHPAFCSRLRCAAPPPFSIDKALHPISLRQLAAFSPTHLLAPPFHPHSAAVRSRLARALRRALLGHFLPARRRRVARHHRREQHLGRRGGAVRGHRPSQPVCSADPRGVPGGRRRVARGSWAARARACPPLPAEARCIQKVRRSLSWRARNLSPPPRAPGDGLHAPPRAAHRRGLCDAVAEAQARHHQASNGRLAACFGPAGPPGGPFRLPP
jgi:hypothetical protein